MPDKPKLLILSSGLLTDRVLLFTDIVKELEKTFDLKVWAISAKDTGLEKLWIERIKDVETFPEFIPFKEFPYNTLRRVNEYIWDRVKKPACRLSHYRLRRKTKYSGYVKFLMQTLGNMVVTTRTEQQFENWLNRFLSTYRRSPDAENRLKTYKPDIVMSMGFWWYEEPSVIPYFQRMNIPVIGYISNWDNPFTNPRFLYDFCAYTMWNEQMHQHLNWFYPKTKEVTNYITGAPQFDILHNPDFKVSREEFCAQYGLDPGLPIIMYATGSPNMWDETEAIVQIAKKVKEGYFGKVNYLVRPHPLFDHKKFNERLDEMEGVAVIQQTSRNSKVQNKRSQDENAIRDWVNTFYHSNVVVNISSTSAIDAAVLDKPVVNLDFDPDPKQENQQYIKEINHLWEHFKPAAESGGMWLPESFDDMFLAIKTYLENPELHKKERREMAEFVCNNMDGRSAIRVAEAVKDIFKKVSR